MAVCGSLAELGARFALAGDLFDHYLNAYLHHFAVDVTKLAVSKLGHYQAAIGPYPAWPELQEATQRIRVALGSTPNDPLYRFGGMFDETKYDFEQKSGGRYEIVVGSTADYAWRQELGDGRTPPRPWLAPAMWAW